MNTGPSRAERTREALVEAATSVFREQAFHETKIADIAARAQVAHGSFYTHFVSKEEIFLEVVRSIVADGFHRTSIRRQIGEGASPAEQIAATNRRYFAFIRDNARILASIETLAPVSPAVREMRQQSVTAYTNRAASAIRKWQADAGVAATGDVGVVAHSLNAMVERVAHHLYVMGGDEPAEADVLDALTDIWLAAVGLRS